MNHASSPISYSPPPLLFTCRNATIGTNMAAFVGAGVVMLS